MSGRAMLCAFCAVGALGLACVKEAQTLEEAGYGDPVGIRMVLEGGEAYEIMLALSKEEAPEKHIEGIAGLVHKAVSACPGFLSEGVKKAPRRVLFDIKGGKVEKPKALAPSETAKTCLIKALDGEPVSSAQARSFMVMAELRGRSLK